MSKSATTASTFRLRVLFPAMISRATTNPSGARNARSIAAAMRGPIQSEVRTAMRPATQVRNNRSNRVANNRQAAGPAGCGRQQEPGNCRRHIAIYELVHMPFDGCERAWQHDMTSEHRQPNGDGGSGPQGAKQEKRAEGIA